MIIKSIPGFSKYSASTDGNLFSKRRKLKINPKKSDKKECSNGYRRTYLKRDDGVNQTVYVARLIALTFIPNPKNLPQINHINGVKWDDRVENLEWCTPSQNIRHAFRVGLCKSREGENNSNFRNGKFVGKKWHPLSTCP